MPNFDFKVFITECNISSKDRNTFMSLSKPVDDIIIITEKDIYLKIA